MLLFLNSNASDGNMAINYSHDVALENSKKFFSKNNIKDENTVYLNISDNNIIEEYSEELVSKEPYGIRNIKADAIITKDKNIFLYQKFADCIPFTVYDEKQNILVFAHMGIVSTIKDLHIEIIKKLVSEYNCKVENLKCFLGPSIKKESYLKKIDDKNIIDKWEDYLEKQSDDMYFVDMQGYIVNSLINMNILSNNISVSLIDTFKDSNYFSHFKSKNDPNLSEQRFIYGVMMI